MERWIRAKRSVLKTILRRAKFADDNDPAGRHGCMRALHHPGAVQEESAAVYSMTNNLQLAGELSPGPYREYF